ncbi:MAG: hypothetical protein JF616_17160 [Fibrobacteres bacterium]|nr:hypothetical protein [Fibrobacterota bacterium]
MPVLLPRISRIFLILALAAAGIRKAPADTVKPLLFGPFFMNQISITGSPAGYDYILTNGFYHFQVGWIEPIAQGNSGLFSETYFETDGNLNVSPFTSDVGTTFNLKPLRYLELGLSYNRMMFHNSMVSFASPNGLPDKRLYRPDEILSRRQELGGADIFTYHANFTLDMGLAQFYLSGSRTLWDMDAKGKDYVYEYGDGLLLSIRDRVNYAMAQTTFDLRPHSVFHKMSFVGLALRDQYWATETSKLKKNLVSGGITGIRLGQNSRFQRRGLDLSLGYWTLHDQIPSGNFVKSWVIIADWQWNIHVLKI